MAKYIIFQNNEFYRLAPNEAKRDKWLVTPNIIAKEVNDADYRKVWCKMSTVTLNGDTINYDDTTIFNFTDTDPSEPKDLNATESQAAVTWARDNLIKEIKHFAERHYDNDADAKAMVSFLEGIDMNQVPALNRTDSPFAYIYDLDGNPCLSGLELFY